jgi:predicted glycogen debranching enzyme
MPEYNTIDATLWFFNAIHEYYEHSHDRVFLKSLYPVLRDIIEWHYKGTRYNIKVDADDELLGGGAEAVQLTWMDAKVGNWVVTPRRGKPVEINALWYNALRCMESFAEILGAADEAARYKSQAEKVSKSFNEKFWNEKLKCLYDYIDGSVRNDDLRPNQIFALSLPFPVVTNDKAKKILQTVTDNLLTPRGLRSLAGFHKEYRPAYGGDVWMRDGCYHQGTVWSYLLGPYIDALIYVKGEKGKAEATKIIKKFLDHLDEAGVGTVSEIFDAEAPHVPRGCIAQAWGVGEVLRVMMKYG